MEGKAKKTEVIEVETMKTLCVSPGVVETISPSEVSVAVLRHLHGKTALGLNDEKKGTEPDTSYQKYGERRSVHQSSDGIAFCVVSEALEPFVSVWLLDE